MKFIQQQQQKMARLRTQIQHGFSLIELMVTVSILAILLAIGVPSFIDIMLSSKLSSYANNFLASTYLTRGEAIKRNRAVTLCASSNSTTCGGSWEQGWIVTLLPEETVLHREQALNSGFKMTGTGGISRLDFQGTGVGATQATLTVCRATPLGKQERVIRVSATGRAAVSKTATGLCS